MRSSKSRSRSKTNRPRTVGNIVNRVFDSSGPEGKVRGTPQQIIEKYLFLARDAQLSNDRVAAENFLQHAEHYTRMLGEAQRELAAEMEARPPQQQQNYQGGQNGQNGQPREGYRDQQPREGQPYRDQPREQQQQPRDQQPREGYRDQPRDQQPRREDRDYRADYARDVSIDDQPYTRRTEGNDPVVDETGLVETPESRARSDQRRANEDAGERAEAPRQEQPPRQDRGERKDRRPERRQDPRPRRDDAQPVVTETVSNEAAEPMAAPEAAPVVQTEAAAPKPRAPRKPKVPKAEGDVPPPSGPREAAE